MDRDGSRVLGEHPEERSDASAVDVELDAEEWQPEAVAQALQDHPKIGRNAACPCGSGKKYKKCCLEVDAVLGPLNNLS